MNIHFRVFFPATGAWASEWELSPPTDAQRIALRAMTWFEGAIRIVGDDGATAEIVGALEPWVQNLCLNGTTRLLSGLPSDIKNFSGPDDIRLEPEEGWARLSGDLVPPVRFPIDALAPALVECAVRFLAWGRAVRKDDPSYLGYLDEIGAALAPAQEAVRAAGLSGR